MVVENRRDKVLIMKLVGATDCCIHRPCLYMGFWFGVWADSSQPSVFSCLVSVVAQCPSRAPHRAGSWRISPAEF